MPSSFRFVHAADLHLGSPFKGLSARDPELARRFAEATRKAFTTLVSRTLELAADFMVIAGDVYDGEWQDNAVGLFFNREIARLERAGIPVFVLRGNHDAESVVTRSISMPANVRGFDTRKPQTHLLEPLRVALHGQSFADRSQGDNLARSYPAPEPGWFNIGVLHTSLTGRPPHADYAPCSVDDLRARGYDYWALGHVHDHEVIDTDPHMVFPGNLQGRSIRETGAKGAVLVTVTDGRVTGCERLIVDEARWALLELDISGLADLDAILLALEEALRPHVQAAEGRALAVRLRLTGENPLRAWLLANRALLRDEAQAAAARVDADVSLEKLVLDVTGGEPPTPGTESGDPLIDLGGMLAAQRHDPEVLAAVEEVVGQVTGKMPHGLGADLDTGPEALAALIEEAGEVLLQKVGGKD